MTLPDWTTGINTQINAFLTWGTVASVVQIVIGVTIGALVLSLLMRTFLRGS